MKSKAASLAVKQAAVAAFLSAAVTLVLVLLAMRPGAADAYGLFNDPVNFFSVLIVAVCGVGLLRYSRAAALILFFYFLLSKFYISLVTGQPSGIGLGLILLYFFGRGVWGSFVYHQLRRAQDPAYRAAPRWTYVLGIPAIVLFFFGVIFGLLSDTGYFPATGVIEGSQLSARQQNFLQREGIVEPDEELQLFYSTGITTIEDEGNLLTNRRIVSYERVEGQLLVHAAPISDLASVRMIKKGDLLSDTLLEIRTGSGQGFLIVLSVENGGDERFVDQIRTLLLLRSGDSSSPQAI